MTKDKTVTIYDIARKAGVSPATVSRVLTGNARVNPAKKELIHRVMEELNFHPNQMARTLQSRETRTIGVILPDISNPFFSEYFVEAERIAMQKGYTMFLCNTMNNAYNDLGDAESVYLNTLLERRVDGILFMGGRINESRPSEEHSEEILRISEKVPMVLVNGRMPGVDNYRVRTNERDGIIQVIEHLISRGHENIALLGGYKGVITADLKVRAFRDVLKKHGLKVREDRIVSGGFSIEDGERMVADLLKEPDRPTAIVCISDFVAIGVLQGALKAGLRVPEDLSITGFDDINISAHYVPSITTVSHNFERLAGRSLEVLFKVIAGEKVPRETTLPMDLIVRESTGSLE